MFAFFRFREMICGMELLLILLSSYTIISRCTDGWDAVVVIDEEESRPLTSSERKKYRSLAMASSNKILKDWKTTTNKNHRAITEMKGLELKLKLYLQHEESLEQTERTRKAKENENTISSSPPSKPGGRSGRKSLDNKDNKRPIKQDRILTINEILGYTWHNPNFSEGEVRLVVVIISCCCCLLSEV